MAQSNPAPASHFNFDQFGGFGQPNTTQVPDLLFDQIMQDLDEKELKVLLYIIRRTFGFKKTTDNISLNQMVNGITTRGGKILDRGTGLSKASVTRALQSLKQKNLINAIQNRNAEKGNLPTTYSLRMQTDPCLSTETRGVSLQKQALVSPVRHTTNSKTTNSSTTAACDTSGLHNREIAAALIEKGIDQRTARYLGSHYSRERLTNNIDLLEHVLKTSPQTVSRNPAGWLRRAIEQDFAGNGQHHGFQTRQQKTARATARKQRLVTQQQALDAREREQRTMSQQQKLARRKQLETLREQYRSTPREQKIWEKTLDELRSTITETQFNLYLSQTHLLSIQDEQAVIAVPNAFIRNYVADRWSTEIEQTLAQRANQRKVTLQFLTLDETGVG
jgi:hypothetical protein